MAKNKPLIIGLVGPSGSGKTTAAKHLKKKNYYLITLSDYIRKEAKKRGPHQLSKKILQNIGNQMRRKRGPQILAQLALKDIGNKKKKKVVIDGIRNLYEVGLLQTEERFFLLGMEAQSKIRYQRIVKSKGKKWVGSYNDFLKIERRENELGKKEIGLRVQDCLAKADKIIDNNEDLNGFYCQLDQYLAKIK